MTRPCPDTSRWQDMQRLSRIARAKAEAQDASEIGGIEPRDLRFDGRIAVVVFLGVLGLAIWVGSLVAETLL